MSVDINKKSSTQDGVEDKTAVEKNVNILTYPFVYKNKNNSIFLNTELQTNFQIIDNFYMAAVDSIKWPNILQQILLNFDASYGFVMVYDNCGHNLLLDCQIGNLNFNKEEIFEDIKNGKLIKNSIFLRYSNFGVKAILLIGKAEDSADFNLHEKEEFSQFQIHFERIHKLISNIKRDEEYLENYISSLEHINKLNAIISEKYELIFVSNALKKAFNLINNDDFLKLADFVSILKNLKLNIKNSNEIDFEDNKYNIILSFIDDFKLNDKKNKLFLIDLNKIEVENKIYISDAIKKYALTKSEGEIIYLLLNGYDVSKIALKRSSSRETVRAQLRSLRAKTGAKSLVELIAIVKNNIF